MASGIGRSSPYSDADVHARRRGTRAMDGALLSGIGIGSPQPGAGAALRPVLPRAALARRPPLTRLGLLLGRPRGAGVLVDLQARARQPRRLQVAAEVRQRVDECGPTV